MRIGHAWGALLFGLAGIAVVVACGSGGDGSAGGTAPDGAPLPPPGAPGALPPAAPLPREQLAQELAKLACEPLEHCCKAVGLEYVAGACAAAVPADAGAPVIPIPPDGDPATYDPQAAGDCVQAYRRTIQAYDKACAEGPPERQPNQSYKAYRSELVRQAAVHIPGGALALMVCQRVFRGTKKPGEPCTGEWECEPSDPNATVITRSCRPPNGGSTEKVCEVTVLVREGEPCDPDSTSEHAACAPPASVDLNAATAEDLFYCAPDTRTCKRRQKVADGQSCADEGVFCAPHDSYCRSSDETCQPLLPDGAECSGTGCFSEQCSDGTCAARLPIGSPCDDDSQCESDQCSRPSKTCIPYPAVGATPLACSGKVD